MLNNELERDFDAQNGPNETTGLADGGDRAAPRAKQEFDKVVAALSADFLMDTHDNAGQALIEHLQSRPVGRRPELRIFTTAALGSYRCSATWVEPGSS